MELKFAKRVLELRKEKGLTQNQIAKALNVSQRTISFWEKGERECDLQQLIKIAEFFEVSTDYILGFAEF